MATFLCWGTTHFCTACHQKQDSGDYVTRKAVSELPKCPGFGQCPLACRHPPNGTEFTLVENPTQHNTCGARLRLGSERQQTDGRSARDSCADTRSLASRCVFVLLCLRLSFCRDVVSHCSAHSAVLLCSSAVREGQAASFFDSLVCSLVLRACTPGICRPRDG